MRCEETDVDEISEHLSFSTSTQTKESVWVELSAADSSAEGLLDNENSSTDEILLKRLDLVGEAREISMRALSSPQKDLDLDLVKRSRIAEDKITVLKLIEDRLSPIRKLKRIEYVSGRTSNVRTKNPNPNIHISAARAYANVSASALLLGNSNSNSDFDFDFENSSFNDQSENKNEDNDNVKDNDEYSNGNSVNDDEESGKLGVQSYYQNGLERGREGCVSDDENNKNDNNDDEDNEANEDGWVYFISPNSMSQITSTVSNVPQRIHMTQQAHETHQSDQLQQSRLWWPLRLPFSSLKKLFTFIVTHFTPLVSDNDKNTNTNSSGASNIHSNINSYTNLNTNRQSLSIICSSAAKMVFKVLLSVVVLYVSAILIFVMNAYLDLGLLGSSRLAT